MKPMINEFDALTGENIESEMTDSQYEQFLIDQEAFKVRLEAEETKAIVKASAEAKLAALGLTSDEVKAIIG